LRESDPKPRFAHRVWPERSSVSKREHRDAFWISTEKKGERKFTWGKEVYIESRSRIEWRQRLGGLPSCEPIVADQLPPHRTVLLFDPGLIVLPVGAGTRELYAGLTAIRQYRFMDEGAIVIRVASPQRTGKPGPPAVERFDD
jgi:hypothetical protein